MTYKESDTIYLKHSNEKAIIIDIIDSETVMVRTEDEIEFPVYVSEVYDKPQIQHIKREKVSSATIKCTGKPLSEMIYIAWNFLYTEDQILLEPFLINGDSKLLNIEWKILHGQHVFSSQNISIQPHHYTKSAAVPEQLIDNNWKVELNGNYVFSDMTTSPLKLSQRIKPSLFSQDLIVDPAINKRVRIQELNPPKTESHLQKEALREYAESLRKKQTTSDSQSKPTYRKINLSDINEFATFNTVLDLHLEAIVDNPSDFSGKDAIEMQLKVLDEYLFNALRLNITSVFIIHGIGKGKLKQEIEQKLRRHPAIRTYRNDHHPRYGFGATEIFFK